MINWYIYRLPGETETRCGSSERLLRGFAAEGGFVIAPFDGDPAGIYTIPDEGVLSADRLPRIARKVEKSRLPQKSTTREEHRQAVTAAIEQIKCGRLEKCVIARAIVNDYMVDVYDTFHQLCKKLPDAFVFAFDTAQTGLWMGASPETLVAKNGTEFRSIALAGTRPSGSNGEWDAKNINEQDVVRKFIESTFAESGLNVQSGPRHTRKAGPVEHIATDITGETPSGQKVELRDLAQRLSPTPALSGFPRDHVIEFIKRMEHFDRIYYGGYCGPNDSKGNGRLFVNLRSMQIEYCRFCIYTGGGIMVDSDPDTEWEETCRKASTLDRNIVYEP